LGKLASVVFVPEMDTWPSDAMVQIRKAHLASDGKWLREHARKAGPVLGAAADLDVVLGYADAWPPETSTSYAQNATEQEKERQRKLEEAERYRRDFYHEARKQTIEASCDQQAQR
jgi:hypothetical protein